MIWRALLVAGLVALALAVGVSSGGKGVLILGFFYFWAGVWVVFLLGWGWIARIAGYVRFTRLDGPNEG
jgi:hypothetical protein